MSRTNGVHAHDQQLESNAFRLTTFLPYERIARASSSQQNSAQYVSRTNGVHAHDQQLPEVCSVRRAVVHFRDGPGERRQAVENLRCREGCRVPFLLRLILLMHTRMSSSQGKYQH